jgi:hypothetical protein
MSKVETAESFAVRVLAARVRIKADRMLDRPSPDWIIELVEEGERRERAQQKASAS